MLRSTHRPQPLLSNETSRLPLGWTQHTAPTGHTYYHNAETKESTYQRPQPTPIAFQPPPLPPSNTYQLYANPAFPNSSQFFPHFRFSQTRPGKRGRSGPLPDSQPTRVPQDRPKSKHEIPGCAPWLLIKTRLGRRFVHNTETKESLWKFSPHVIGGVVEYDIQERQRRQREEDQRQVPDVGKVPNKSTEKGDSVPLGKNSEEAVQDSVKQPQNPAVLEHENEEEFDEIEEVEVTDDEDELGEENRAKRLRMEEPHELDSSQQEFQDDDMEYQLAQLGDLQPDQEMDNYGQEEDEKEGSDQNEDLEIAEQDAKVAFKELLDEYRINPFTTWENVVDEGRILEDYRYSLVHIAKTRKDLFVGWSVDKIHTIRMEKEKQAELDPRVPYLALLHKHATAKLFWPEFRRKYKREPEMKELRLSDKERERLYREHIHRTTKSSESKLKEDLQELLQSIPPTMTWNRESTLDGPLPSALQADIRYISLKPKTRNAAVRNFIRSLPNFDKMLDERQREELVEKRAARSKQERALIERQERVDEAKRRRRRDMNEGREALEREKTELHRAMRFGRKGLAAHLHSEDGPIGHS